MSPWKRLLRLLPHATSEPMTLEDLEEKERQLRRELRAFRKSMNIEEEVYSADPIYREALKEAKLNKTPH